MSSGSKTAKKYTSNNKNINKNKNITNIIFKNINDEYAWGKFGDFKVIIMKENGFINATKLCGDAKTKSGTRKDFSEWKKNSSANEIINKIKSGGNPYQLLVNVVMGPNDIRETYAHPDLIPHIASWASPKFAVRVSRIINKYFVKKASKEKLIQKKDDKIDKLNK
jgi:hypothetical protein